MAVVVFIVSAIWFYGRDKKTAYAKKNAFYLEQLLSTPG
jgi:hypothetical protein